MTLGSEKEPATPSDSAAPIAVHQAQSNNTASETNPSNTRKRSHEEMMENEATIQLRPAIPPLTLDSPQLLGVKGFLQNEVRLPNKERRTMVFLITTVNIRDGPAYSRPDARSVADQLVATFPKSVKDTVFNPKNPIGSDSLRHQFIVCLENATRDPSKKAKEMARNPQIPKAHGCVQWDPPMSPDKTEADHRSLMREMQHTFASKNPSEWDFKNDILPKLEETYTTQRKDINHGVCRTKLKKNQRPPKDLPDPIPVSELQAKWPFLFFPQGLDLHFKLLTGVPFNEKFMNWIDDTVVDLTKTLQNANDFCKKLTTLLEGALENKTCEAPKVLAAFLMMITFFKDDIKDIIIRAEVNMILDIYLVT